MGKKINPLALAALGAGLACCIAGALALLSPRPHLLSAELDAAIAVAIGSVLAWVVSVPLRDVSIVDIWWGLGFLVQSLAVSLRRSLDARQCLCLGLVAVWSLRLALYLTWRKVQEGGREDPRYNDYVLVFKRGLHPDWLVVVGSLANPFILQGAMILAIGLPLLTVLAQQGHPLGFVDLAACLAWGIGFVFEAGSDLQLALFKRSPANHGKVLSSGFFGLTRHPNYFGDSLVWLGYWLLALASDLRAGALTLGSPVTMFILLRYVSGAAMLDEIKSQDPKYRDYIARTSPFVPWPRS